MPLCEVRHVYIRACVMVLMLPHWMREDSCFPLLLTAVCGYTGPFYHWVSYSTLHLYCIMLESMELHAFILYICIYEM